MAGMWSTVLVDPPSARSTLMAFSSDFYEASIESVEEGKKYKVKVNFRPGADQKSYVDEMIINTDDPQEPSIRVRLIARGVL